MLDTTTHARALSLQPRAKARASAAQRGGASHDRFPKESYAASGKLTRGLVSTHARTPLLQSEIQQIRCELERREKDIGQLLSDNDYAAMENELRSLRSQLDNAAADVAYAADAQLPQQTTRTRMHSTPHDYTEKTLSTHETHTLKQKMEQSELKLCEKQRLLQSCELKLKNADEQNRELEKHVEVANRSSITQEAQLKLLQDDVNILRSKLETRNQLVESKRVAVRHEALG